jgi:cytochrome c556
MMRRTFEALMAVWKLSFLALLLALLAASAVARADVINTRRDGLKAVGVQMDRIEALLEQRGDPRLATTSIAEMIRFFENLPRLFPPDSGTGETRARPSIWSNPGGFEAANTNMLESLLALEAAAHNGDRAGFHAAFQQSAATCSACHRPFRSRGR